MRARVIKGVLILYPIYGGPPKLFRHNCIDIIKFLIWNSKYQFKWRDELVFDSDRDIDNDKLKRYN